MGGFESSVVVWKKRALGFLGFFLSPLLLDTLGTVAAGHPVRCGFLLSLPHSSEWKWHLQTPNTDNYSRILWESLI